MWTRGILTRYADTLKKDDRERLQREIKAIPFEKRTEICVAIEAERAFTRAGIKRLYADLSSRLMEFIRPEDMEALKSYK